MPSVIMLSVIKQCAIMLNVVMLNVLAPIKITRTNTPKAKPNKFVRQNAYDVILQANAWKWDK
jgi:hypothetical protein